MFSLKHLREGNNFELGIMFRSEDRQRKPDPQPSILDPELDRSGHLGNLHRDFHTPLEVTSDGADLIVRQEWNFDVHLDLAGQGREVDPSTELQKDPHKLCVARMIRSIPPE